jgi:HAD superfamily hydrolase (TIGR01509 family)
LLVCSAAVTSLLSPSALVFDMDGLLVDSEPLWFSVEREFVLARGGDWTAEHAADCVGKGMPHTLSAMGALLGVAVDLDRGVAELVDRFVARARTLRFKPGALELLDAARDLPLALASSSPRRLVHAVIEPLGVAPRLRAVVTGDDVERTKPAPDPFLLAARLLGVAPDRCVAFEDSLAGATSAHAAGMQVIAVPETERTRPLFVAVAHAIVGDLFEARRLLDLRGTVAK